MGSTLTKIELLVHTVGAENSVVSYKYNIRRRYRENHFEFTTLFYRITYPTAGTHIHTFVHLRLQICACMHSQLSNALRSPLLPVSEMRVRSSY